MPGFGYADLGEIHNGAQATVQLARIIAGDCDADAEQRLRAALRAYCARDTEALVRVHEALRTLAASPAGSGRDSLPAATPIVSAASGGDID